MSGASFRKIRFFGPGRRLAASEGPKIAGGASLARREIPGHPKEKGFEISWPALGASGRAPFCSRFVRIALDSFSRSEWLPGGPGAAKSHQRGPARPWEAQRDPRSSSEMSGASFRKIPGHRAPSSNRVLEVLAAPASAFCDSYGVFANIRGIWRRPARPSPGSSKLPEAPRSLPEHLDASRSTREASRSTSRWPLRPLAPLAAGRLTGRWSPLWPLAASPTAGRLSGHKPPLRPLAASPAAGHISAGCFSGRLSGCCFLET